MSTAEEVERALRQALDCRADRRRAEETLSALRRQEEECFARLETLMRERGSQSLVDKT